MKKNSCVTRRCQKKPHLRKIWMTMKLMMVLFFLAITNLMASEAYSQSTKLTLQLKDATVREVLYKIEENSEFFFLYNGKLVDVDRKVSVEVNDQKISEILGDLFRGTNACWTVVDRQIVLTNKANQNSIMQLGSQQPQKVSGTVTDKDGFPLPGVNVVVTGTTQGMITDIAGKYSIEVPQGSESLTFSFIGMESQEINIGTSTQINVSMVESSVGLEEVVVIGYGTKSKQTLTGAVSIINNTELESRPAAKTTDLIQGISSGVQITRTNTGDLRSSTNNITIRGITSRSAPGVLVVIDGIAQASTSASSLDNINPDDIESISILKDSQAAIYGARAAGGVILVTTKAGKSGKPTINFSANTTIQSPSLMRRPTNILDYYEMNYEGFVNDGQLTNAFAPIMKFISDNKITFSDISKNDQKYVMTEPFGSENAYALGHYDWNDIMFDPALQQNHNLSVSGISDKLKYYESVNYLNQDGMLAYGSNYKKRLLITLKNDYDVTSFLTIKSNFSLGNQQVVEPYGYSSNNYNNGIQGSLFFTLPVIQPHTNGGHYMNIGGFHDPIGYAKDAGNTTDLSYKIHGTLGAEITPFKDFLISAEIASHYDLMEEDYASIGFPLYDYYDKVITMSSDAATGPNKAGAFYSRNRYTVGNLYAKYSYEKSENHKISLMAGYSHEENDYRYFGAYRRYGLISPELPTMALGAATEQYNGEAKSDYAMNSMYSRLEYGYKNRYLFEGIFRYDGTSKFAEGHKWAPFYGMSGAWIISDEGFMKNLKNVIDFLKFRASWGQLGNQSGIGLYDYVSMMNIGGSYPMGNWNSPTRSQSATLGAMASKTRTWEKIESKNLGVDFRAINSKLTGSFDAFIKDNKDMFFNQEFPQVLGTIPPNINGAHVRTNGWEMEIGWRDKIQNFNYFMKVNLSDNRTKVIELADAVIPVEWRVNDFIQGYPAMSYFGYQYDGLIQNDAELTAYNSSISSGIPNNLKPGDARFKDLNGDGKLTTLLYTLDKDGKPTATSGDLIQIGDAGQHYLYGITLGANWKNLDFSSFFQGVLKQQVVSNTVPDNQWYEPNEQYFYHQTWAPDRTNARWPRLSENGNVNYNNYQSSNAPYLFYNNKYIRLKNIQIGYTFQKNITSKLNIDQLRIYFSGTDIWEHSNLPGNQDPETPFARRLSPFPRQYSFGLNLTF